MQKVDAETLRLDFKARYHRFKLLLGANHQALAIMAQIEAALEGSRPFGMQFVRAKTVEAYTRVHQIVDHLQALAPGKYTILSQRLEALHTDLEALTEPSREVDPSGPLTLPLSGIDKTAADQVGMKMANLGELANRLGLRVPAGFAVTAAGFRRFLAATDLGNEIRRRIQVAGAQGPEALYTTSATIRGLIQAAPLPLDLQAAIDGAGQKLARGRRGREASPPLRLAVRSSALDEDQEEASFAGLYDSRLNVPTDQLCEAYKAVVAAVYSPAVMAYRLNRGVRDDATAMSVGVLAMVDAVCGGVIYSVNPLDQRDGTLVINSVWGLPKAVVDGTTTGDLIRVGREPHLAIRQREAGRQATRYRCDPSEGLRREPLSDAMRGTLSLNDAQALELAAAAIAIEAHYGAPQDIEWAIDRNGAIVLLQCRPLQVAELPREPGALAAETRRDDLPPEIYRGGTTAAAGVATGTVYTVVKEADALQFPTGAVLATDRALARWAALLPRASAVVSERGSIAGHLANVAREYGVPALFGADGALQALTGAAEITVDADNRRIYAGVAASLLSAASPSAAKGLMQGTRVHAVLEKAAALITPLTLIDPDSPAFKAANCRTLHDLTRFCHEKSVHEMFRFGKDHHFPERSSKQLRAEIPMQWWVLNLDDGYYEDRTEARFVDIDNIASLPMRALWDGITAAPWQGPPPVDGRGFAAVMFEATRNQALLPTVRTSMANRNYFMIARNYCSLQSRLGFHFAITEALVDERTRENYIAFQFKGGAADESRRLKRVLLVKEILDAHGFRTEVSRDALRARIEQLEMAAMLARLRMLGYLTIHTRQLDMVMGNPAMVSRYRRALSEAIKKLIREVPEYGQSKDGAARSPRSAVGDAAEASTEAHPASHVERTAHVVTH